MSKVEDFKRDAEIYYKNKKAIQSINALIDYANRESCANDWVTLDVIMGNVVSSLEDYDVKIKYKQDNSFPGYVLIDLKEDIREKYEDDIEKEERYSVYAEVSTIEGRYNVADLLHKILNKKGSYEQIVTWINEILCSEMDLSERTNFLLDVLKGNKIGLKDTICTDYMPYKMPYDPYKKTRMNELRNYVQATPWINEKVVEIMGTSTIIRYMENNDIDMSSPATVKKAIELVKEHKSKSKDVYELMKSLRYQNNVSEEQKNDDILNIFAQADIRYIDYYTCFLEFDFDPEIMLIIAGLMRDNWNSIERPESLRDHLYKYFFEKQLDYRDDYEEYGKKFLEIVNDRETGAINETKARKDAQNRLIRVLTRTLNKTQEQTIGKINK